MSKIAAPAGHDLVQVKTPAAFKALQALASDPLQVVYDDGARGGGRLRSLVYVPVSLLATACNSVSGVRYIGRKHGRLRDSL